MTDNSTFSQSLTQRSTGRGLAHTHAQQSWRQCGAVYRGPVPTLHLLKRTGKNSKDATWASGCGFEGMAVRLRTCILPA